MFKLIAKLITLKKVLNKSAYLKLLFLLVLLVDNPNQISVCVNCLTDPINSKKNAS